MLFRVVSLSKTKNVYIVHIAGYNIDFIISVMSRTFHCSLCFSSGLILLE